MAQSSLDAGLQAQLRIQRQKSWDPSSRERLPAVEIGTEPSESPGFPSDHEHLDPVRALGRIVAQLVERFARPALGFLEVSPQERAGVGDAAVDMTVVGLAGSLDRSVGIAYCLLHLSGTAYAPR